jgi:hypothetical protein
MVYRILHATLSHPPGPGIFAASAGENSARADHMLFEKKKKNYPRPHQRAIFQGW